MIPATSKNYCCSIFDFWSLDQNIFELYLSSESSKRSKINSSRSIGRLKLLCNDEQAVSPIQSYWWVTNWPYLTSVTQFDIEYRLASHDSKKNIKKYETEFVKELHRKLALGAKSIYYRIGIVQLWQNRRKKSFKIITPYARIEKLNLNSKVNIKTFFDHHTEELIFVQFYLLGLDFLSNSDEPSISSAQVRFHTYPYVTSSDLIWPQRG